MKPVSRTLPVINYNFAVIRADSVICVNKIVQDLVPSSGNKIIINLNHVDTALGLQPHSKNK